jgi:two-component system response regulator HydG
VREPNLVIVWGIVASVAPESHARGVRSTAGETRRRGTIQPEGRRQRASRDGAAAWYGLVGESPAMQAVRTLIVKIAATRLPALIIGESGSGKGVVARAIHDHSNRRGEFVRQNCASLFESLFESVLFGHVKGVFTGAVENRIGLIAAANGGTLFLDEIVQLTPPLQAKLLDVLEDGEYRRVGSTKIERSDFRLATATNENLDQLVVDGKFRNDLLQRINGIRILVPPLREHRVDIPSIARYLLEQHAAGNGGRPASLSPAAANFLMEQRWTGNVRQLGYALERAVAFSGGASVLDVDHFLDALTHAFTDTPTPVAGVPSRKTGCDRRRRRC